MKNEKIYVEYLGGQSRNHIDSKGRISSANYMLVETEIDGEDIEIYAEYVYPELTEEEEADYDFVAHEWDGYDECKESFLAEAAKYGLTAHDFDFSGDTDAEAVAFRIRHAHDWEEASANGDLEELCALAGLSDEYKNADGDTFESVLFRAAEKLGVEIL